MSGLIWIQTFCKGYQQTTKFPFRKERVKHIYKARERSVTVVERLTRDRGAVGSSLTGVTPLCPWARHINPSLVLVKPRKIRPYITERLSMGRKESNQTKKKIYTELFSGAKTLVWDLIYIDTLCIQHKNSGPKKRVCKWKLFFLFLNQKLCCGYSKELSRWEGSFEHPKHMFKQMDKKIIAILHSKKLLNWPYAKLLKLHGCAGLCEPHELSNIHVSWQISL